MSIGLILLTVFGGLIIAGLLITVGGFAIMGFALYVIRRIIHMIVMILIPKKEIK